MQNHAPATTNDEDLDRMMRDLAGAKRRRLRTAALVVFGLAALARVQVLKARWAAASELHSRGYSDIDLKMHGPFTFGFSGKKDGATCAGTFERVVFSTSIEEHCYELTPAALPIPARPENEIVEEGLRAKFPGLPISNVRCDAITSGATKTTCTASPATGSAVQFALSKTDGSWHVDSPSRIATREAIAESATTQLQKKAKGAVVDCGTGLVGYCGGDTMTCTAARKGSKKAGSVALSFDAEGGYTWTAKGI